jgi:hypothetical protein
MKANVRFGFGLGGHEAIKAADDGRLDSEDCCDWLRVRRIV